MVYDESQNNEDMKWACFVFKKHFKNCPFLREDLIQNAVLTLLKNKNKFDNTRGEYSTFAIKVCKNSMANYLRKNNHLTNNGENLSLDYEYENNTFADILPYEVDFDKGLDFDFLITTFDECCAEIKVSKNNKFTKPILEFIRQGFCDIDISKKLGCTRELPRRIRKKIIPIYQDKLKEYGYIV